MTGQGSNCLRFIEAALRRTFVRFSHVLTSHPLPFLLLPVVITLCLLPSFLRYLSHKQVIALEILVNDTQSKKGLRLRF